MKADSINNHCSAYLDSLTKRVLDIVIGSILLIPAIIILIFSGLIILLYEGRPIFFIHYRSGKDGKLFKMPKLRTLRTTANPYALSCNGDLKDLITKTGRLLRKYRLDELPQLFSVLAGNMSIVGPRPELPNVVAFYNSHQKKRLLAKPGLTGLWQILGDHSVQIHENIKYDLYYIRKSNLWLDIKILFGTIFFILKQI